MYDTTNTVLLIKKYRVIGYGREKFNYDCIPQIRRFPFGLKSPFTNQRCFFHLLWKKTVIA